MANKTSIEWTDYNWNFLRGCSRVSEGCRNCYAEQIAARFSGIGQAYHGLADMRQTSGLFGKARWTGEISFHEDILQLPLRWTKPRKVFVNSMSDLFHEKVTDEMLDKAFAVMALTPQHTYQILTKRPERMKAYFSNLECEARLMTAVGHLLKEIMNPSPYRYCSNILMQSEEWIPLPNIWLGVSVEDQKTADERIPLLLQTPAAVRWISAEPLLGPVDLFNWSTPDCDCLGGHDHNCTAQASLDWVVIGGESGPNARPCDISWISQIVDQCKSADVPVFVKQLGARPQVFTTYGRVLNAVILKSRKGGDIDEWPREFRIRQYPRANTLPDGRVSACEKVSA